MYRTVRGKRTRGSTKPLANKISSYGIMAGLVPQRGVSDHLTRHKNRKGISKLVIPSAPTPGLLYMQGDNPQKKYLLSKNPVGSGGVGKMIPNIPCCSAGTVDILRPTRVNLTDIDNSSTGITPTQPILCDPGSGDNLSLSITDPINYSGADRSPLSEPVTACLTPETRPDTLYAFNGTLYNASNVDVGSVIIYMPTDVQGIWFMDIAEPDGQGGMHITHEIAGINYTGINPESPACATWALSGLPLENVSLEPPGIPITLSLQNSSC